MPSFTAWYDAVNHRDPFPWQAGLAADLASGRDWRPVGIPTGLGKTACLDIAIWWLASQADREPADRTAPTRIWWVVNRRLLVDSTADHASRIACALRDPQEHGLTGKEADDVALIANRLRLLSADPKADPLEVIRLRGGIPARTPSDPSRPTVVLCTLPMYGSRLLFRGYGSTRKLRPIDAAMAGTDSLVLLDEAHLAPHLRRLVPALADCTPGAQAILNEHRSRARVVTLTATGDTRDGPPVDLGEADMAHPVVRQRLDAAKPTEVRVRQDKVAAELIDATLDLIRDAPAPATYLVFANTPATARKVFESLKKTAAKRTTTAIDVLLLTGRAREREAERIRARILDPVDGMAAGRTGVPTVHRAPCGHARLAKQLPARNSDGETHRQRHLVVVATQTLEVGADVDAEYLVTEACGVRALTQRLGRLNRLGQHEKARAIYVHVPPEESPRDKRRKSDSKEWPVYKKEPLSVLDRLQAAEHAEPGKRLNLSPRRIATLLGEPGEDQGRAPEVLPGLLREWTKTTTPPRGEAPVEPYFSGIAGPEYSISLIWRAHVPDAEGRLWPQASDREAVDVPIREARDVFADDEELHRLQADGVTVERTSREELRPGDVVILPSDRGLLDDFGWNPSADRPVVDVSLAQHGLPLDATALNRLCGVSIGGIVDTALGIPDDEDEDQDPAERVDAVQEIRTIIAGNTPAGCSTEEWSDFVGSLRETVVQRRNEVPRLPVLNPAAETRSNELDELSLSETAVSLDLHCRTVGHRARTIAERIGLAPGLQDVIEQAGFLHDIGKTDSRFQRWLDPDGEHEGLVAKSGMRQHLWDEARSAAGWPRGGRHEALSARLGLQWVSRSPAWKQLLDRFGRDLATFAEDLLIHLVISHHGKGRPVVPPVVDGTASTVSATMDGAGIAAPADLEIVDWNQPGRFQRLNEQFGPWGLALLEAIIVRADEAVSAGAGASRLEVR